MATRIKVTIFKTAQRPNYLAQWVDPKTGRKKSRSTGTRIKRDAERFAGKLEDDLNAGKVHRRGKTLWSTFRERYQEEVLPGQAVKTGNLFRTAFNTVERIINPRLLSAIDSNAIGAMTRKLRDEEKSEPSIKSYLTHLRVALNWGKKNKLLNEVPHFTMPKRIDGARGRAIAAEEFERMLSKVPDVQGECVADSWAFLLTGLWWSGLRLGEALKLHWTDDRDLCVDFSGRFPMFRIRATAEKGNKDRVLPMAPEFAEFLERVPEDERTGFVFDPRPQRERAGGGRMRLDTVSKSIGKFGKAAGVRVAHTAKGNPRYASAHDMRRAFGFRWSQRIMPPQLMELMRHRCITVTMQFYVGKNADVTAQAVWSALAKQSAKHTDSEAKTSAAEKP